MGKNAGKRTKQKQVQMSCKQTGLEEFVITLDSTGELQAQSGRWGRAAIQHEIRLEDVRDGLLRYFIKLQLIKHNVTLIVLSFKCI